MNNRSLYTIALLSLTLISCHSAATDSTADVPETIVPVTVTNVGTGPMEEFVDLNATAVYQQKWIVKANATGYLQTINVQLNKAVSTGQVLYTVKTKEAESIGNTINKLDPSFQFTGLNSIRSNGTGYISEINRQAGDYVQDGEQLAVITDTKSFVFLLDLPYEMRPYIINKSSLQIVLPDGEELAARVSGNLPVMDSASQTQRIILKVQPTHQLPENLIAKVRLVKKADSDAYYFPRAAVLTDETQANFWVMKLLNDSTAVKVDIKKGMETTDKIQVLSPAFSSQDKILVTGNFGLGDTAKIKIIASPVTE